MDVVEHVTVQSRARSAGAARDARTAEIVALLTRSGAHAIPEVARGRQKLVAEARELWFHELSVGVGAAARVHLRNWSGPAHNKRWGTSTPDDLRGELWIGAFDAFSHCLENWDAEAGPFDRYLTSSLQKRLRFVPYDESVHDRAEVLVRWAVQRVLGSLPVDGYRGSFELLAADCWEELVDDRAARRQRDMAASEDPISRADAVAWAQERLTRDGVRRALRSIDRIAMSMASTASLDRPVGVDGVALVDMLADEPVLASSDVGDPDELDVDDLRALVDDACSGLPDHVRDDVHTVLDGRDPEEPGRAEAGFADVLATLTNPLWQFAFRSELLPSLYTEPVPTNASALTLINRRKVLA